MDIWKLNIGNIITGWWRSYVYAGKDIKKLSDERLKVCVSCPNALDSSVLKVIRGDIEHVLEKKCSTPIGCGCPIREKSLVRSETCPMKKWKS